jgi:hypothetical protein
VLIITKWEVLYDTLNEHRFCCMFESVTIIALSLITNPFLHSSHTCSEIRKCESIVGITASDDGHLGGHKTPHHGGVGFISCPLWRHTWGLIITKILVLLIFQSPPNLPPTRFRILYGAGAFLCCIHFWGEGFILRIGKKKLFSPSKLTADLLFPYSCYSPLFSTFSPPSRPQDRSLISGPAPYNGITRVSDKSEIYLT